MNLKMMLLPHSWHVPKYQSAGASGLDLYAAVKAGERIVLAPTQSYLVPTGVVVEIPSGFEGQVRPRSGLAAKYGISIVNAPGTIDSDYRGEIFCQLINLGTGPYQIIRGARIAQLVISPVTRVRVISSRILSETERGAGGLGSTGD